MTALSDCTSHNVTSTRNFTRRVFSLAQSWSGPIVVTLVGLILLRWSWLKWPDVLIDFGEQIYIPWQLSEGKVLYRDIVYHCGPLSPYLNSLWFSLFHVSILTILIVNIAVLVAITVLLYRLLLQIDNTVSGTIALTIFLLMFAFAQLLTTGNFNYLTPYENSVTYGMLLSLTALNFLARFIRFSEHGAVAGMGISLGLAFLTKAEVFLAAFIATTLGLALTIWIRQAERNGLLRIISIFLGTFFLAPIAFVFFLSLKMPITEAVLGTLGTWPAIFGSETANLPFYKQGMGIADIGYSLNRVFLWIGWYAAVLLPAAAIALMWRQNEEKRRKILGLAFAAVLFVLVTSMLLFKMEIIPWHEIALPLPIWTCLASVVIFVKLWKTRPGKNSPSKLLIELSLLSFAFVLLFKMILNTRIDHYGFALAMPATILFVVALIGSIPKWITRSGGCGHIFFGVGLAILLVTAIVHLRVTAYYFNHKTVIVGKGKDMFYADVRGNYVNFILERIEQFVSPDQTLAVFPEGVILNYLSRRVTPVPYISYNPAEMLIFGENEMLRSLRSTPPDFVLLVHKDTSELGFRFFGRDYAQNIFSWLRANYKGVSLIGQMPLQDDCWFGILLAKRIGTH